MSPRLFSVVYQFDVITFCSPIPTTSFKWPMQFEFNLNPVKRFSAVEQVNERAAPVVSLKRVVQWLRASTAKAVAASDMNLPAWLAGSRFLLTEKPCHAPVGN